MNKTILILIIVSIVIAQFNTKQLEAGEGIKNNNTTFDITIYRPTLITNDENTKNIKQGIKIDGEISITKLISNILKLSIKSSNHNKKYISFDYEVQLNISDYGNISYGNSNWASKMIKKTDFEAQHYRPSTGLFNKKAYNIQSIYSKMQQLGTHQSIQTNTIYTYNNPSESILNKVAHVAYVNRSALKNTNFAISSTIPKQTNETTQVSKNNQMKKIDNEHIAFSFGVSYEASPAPNIKTQLFFSKDQIYNYNTNNYSINNGINAFDIDIKNSGMNVTYKNLLIGYEGSILSAKQNNAYKASDTVKGYFNEFIVSYSTNLYQIALLYNIGTLIQHIPISGNYRTHSTLQLTKNRQYLASLCHNEKIQNSIQEFVLDFELRNVLPIIMFMQLHYCREINSRMLKKTTSNYYDKKGSLALNNISLIFGIRIRKL